MKKRVYTEDGYLSIETGLGTYDIPLDRLKEPAQVLDWIHQSIICKTWGRKMALEILDGIFDAIPKTMWSGRG
jgi:hypothetical protein